LNCIFSIFRSITSIENLSNEFFHEIFDYLDGWDIYKAFLNLNYRFQHLREHFKMIAVRSAALPFSRSTALPLCRYAALPFTCRSAAPPLCRSAAA
jgi:hypothetical protein